MGPYLFLTIEKVTHNPTCTGDPSRSQPLNRLASEDTVVSVLRRHLGLIRFTNRQSG